MPAAPWVRPVLAAAGLALCLRAGLFAGASSVRAGSFMTPDSSEYDRLGRTLLHEGRFAERPAAPAQTRRTPGFPLLVASVYALGGEDPRAVVATVTLTSVFTVALAAGLAYGMAGVRAAWMAGLLLAFDPPSIVASCVFLTDAPFAALLLAAVAFALGLVRDERPRPGRSLLFGTLLAAAALTRPVGLYLVIPVLLWLALCGRLRPWSPRATASVVAAFAVPWIVLVGGWQVRNRIVTGAFVASDGPAKFLYFSRGSDILAQRDGTSFEAARAELTASIEDEAKRTGQPAERHYARAAAALIARHPVLFLKSQARWLPELLLGTGAAGVSLALGLEGADPGRRAAAWLVSAAAALQLALLYAGAAWGLWTLRGEPAGRLAAALLAGIVLYFVILSTGPQAYSRFRVPFTPLLAVCAGCGLARRASQAAASDPSSSQ
ncbi:MAG TPA: glycosyltransferase family 39 protein [Vicinamibacteria bacterium]|nr:glycosyltransferase family 39 protein [Vicinamibacteria bacterium]